MEKQSYGDIPIVMTCHCLMKILGMKTSKREIKHGYYASVSYTDAQIGRLLNELEKTGLT